MKRILPLVIVCLLGTIASAQQSYRLRYWFDRQYQSSITEDFASASWNVPLEVGHLPSGMHTLHLQVSDTSGEWSSPYSYLFCNSGNDTVPYTYFFDNAVLDLQRGFFTASESFIDVLELPDGVHSVNILMGTGNAAVLRSYLFYKTANGLSQTVYYWFDDETVNIHRGIVDESVLIDVSDLSEGFHTINMQLGTGLSAQVLSYAFFRGHVLDNNATSYIAWFDNDRTAAQHGDFSTGSLLIDVSSLNTGLHSLNLQFGMGYSSIVRSFVFYKYPAIDVGTPQFDYAIDGLRQSPIPIQSTGGGMVQLDLEVSTLLPGLHTLDYYITADHGFVTSPQQVFFYKNPLLARYDYWFNGDENTKITTALNSPTDSLLLLTMLPIDTFPIRSTCFQFDPNGGNPVIYSKNEITFRFWNDDFRHTDATRRYVDERVMQIISADTLERDTTKVIPAPVSNSIHWFKLAAGVGDSLSFHTDQPCTLQLFAPSGEEVFSVKGNDVLNWDGCHAWENGVYYLAVHDAEGAGNLAVSYQWIYKYAVLEHSPNITSNAHSIVMVNLLGNGYDKLIDVSFFNVDTSWTMDTLFALDINEAFVEFLVNEDLLLGYYNMLLIFRDSVGSFDSLIIDSAIRVVPARYGEVRVVYDYVSSFTEPHIINFSISNTGNVPYLAVPIIIAHTEPTEASISFYNRNLILDTTEIIDSLYYSASNLFGHNISAKYIPFMISYIGPYETQTMKIAFDCPRGSGFDFYSWTGRPWSTLGNSGYDSVFSSGQMSNTDSDNTGLLSLNSTLRQAKARRNPLCEMPDPCNMAGEMPEIGDLLNCLCGLGVANISALANGHLSQISKGYRNLNNAYREDLRAYGIIDDEEDLYQEIRIQTPSSILREAVEHCIGDGIAQDAVIGLWDHLDGEDCPDPPIPIHPEVPAPPVDPNEIIGYVAISGSHAMGNVCERLPYLIEYENDSLLASGKAHVVIIRDTLDGNVFDLNSFSMTSFTIGEEVVNIEGEMSFVNTVDMRPAVDVLVQVRLDYRIESTFAVATWTFTSIDPMTLQPTVADSLGFLDIGGMGEVNFTINRKANLTDSTIIANRAYIIFDNEEPIATPIWMNIVDNTPPTSVIDSMIFGGGTAKVSMTATDNLSGVWRYHVFGQVGETWLPLAMNVPSDSMVLFAVDTSQFTAFRTTAIDSAGNVEPIAAVLPAVKDTLFATACDNYLWRGNSYNESGDYQQTAHSNMPGVADTVFVLRLSVNRSTTGDTTAVACNSFSWHGTSYNADGTYVFHMTNVAGCDSTVTLHLTVNHGAASTETVTACDSWQGYTADTVLVSTVTAANGCDSTHNVVLTVNSSVATAEAVTACDSWQGYTADTVLVTTATAANGCDSTHTITLTVNRSVATTEAVSACDSWQGYTADTVLVTTATAANGCDSTHTVAVTINHSVETLITDTAEDSYTWHGNEYTESGTYTWQGTTSDGCDSTVTLMLVISQEVGIEVIDSQTQVSVYPNPTSGWLTIGSDKVAAVEVFDPSGRRVAVFHDTNRIYLGDLPSGGYLLRIHLADSMATQRVQLNR